MKFRYSIVYAGVSMALGLGISAAALADHYDARFGHDRSYPDRGFAVRALPRDRMFVPHGRDRFFYSRGTWYAPRGGAYIVVAPPPGVFIPALPPFYSTVWFGGIPYYYANDTYYLWNTQRNSYEVVAPPPGAASAPADAPPQPAPPVTHQMFVYPGNGQSQEQQSKDQYECHTWAVGQTGFDPTASGGNVPPDQYGPKSTAYSRALGACLTGRGYSVQ